jgi:hypothetical protein
MSVVFNGQVGVRLNRHDCLGDGIVLTFPHFTIFQNTSGKYSLQIRTQLIRTDYESVTDAFVAGQVHLGKLELKDGAYVPVNA